jgi:hypothetical protein
MMKMMTMTMTMTKRTKRRREGEELVLREAGAARTERGKVSKAFSSSVFVQWGP